MERELIELENVAVCDLKPHPRNYNSHPDDEIAHIVKSIKDNGVYRNVVIARDNTILAGHGVIQAMKQMGMDTAPVRRLDIDSDDPRALKVLAGDNEIGHLSMKDDRMLTELLKEISEFDDGLLGTGYDDMMLANLLYVTRDANEIADFDAAAEWVGMPEYEEGDGVDNKLVVNFRSIEDRQKFAQILGLVLPDGKRSTWWPDKKPDDSASVRFKA